MNAQTQTNPPLQISASRQFTSWLAEQRLSLCFSTYQVGKLFLVGLGAAGHLSIHERTFMRCMGIHATAQTLYVGTLFQLWRFENALRPGENYQGYDRLYIPQVGHTLGDIDIHDVAVDGHGKPVFVNTLFSCLATVSDRYSFEPLWQPPFVSKLAAEDRCHLNGLAMREGEPAYVTCVGVSDVNEGWREHRQSGGVLIDVRSNEIVCRGLSMPHSPRVYRGKVWLLNSGSGELGFCDLESGRFEPVAFCPGYLRGLTFTGDFAVVGLSKPRKNNSFSGLSLDDRLRAKGASARCALQIIDLRRGDVVHELRIEGIVEELYDVAVVPGVRQPMALGLKTDEIRRIFSLPPAQ
jgi:uncharacterized protein (TIGR03032 family)